MGSKDAKHFGVGLARVAKSVVHASEHFGAVWGSGVLEYFGVLKDTGTSESDPKLVLGHIEYFAGSLGKAHKSDEHDPKRSGRAAWSLEGSGNVVPDR